MATFTKRMKQRVKWEMVSKAQEALRNKFNTDQDRLAREVIKARCGADVFEKTKKLPEGWLVREANISIENDVRRFVHYPRYSSCSWLKLNESLRVPDCARKGIFPAKPIPDELAKEIAEMIDGFNNDYAKLGGLDREFDIAMTDIRTLDQLKAAWPEAYACLPDGELPNPTTKVPALPIQDLNTKLRSIRIKCGVASENDKLDEQAEEQAKAREPAPEVIYV